MLTSADAQFNYAALPAEKAASARAAAERIRGRMQLAAESIIEVGRELIEQKKQLGHGNFLPWIEAEFGMSRDSAHRFMTIASELGGNVEHVRHLSSRTLYALAAPSTPEPVRTEVLNRAADGEAVTAKQITELKAKHERLQEKLKEQAGIIQARDDMVAIAQRQSREAHTKAMFAEADKERLAVELEDTREEIERLKEPGVITLFNEAHVQPTNQPTPWTDDDAQFLTLQSVWQQACPEARRRFSEWLSHEGVAA